ncbi:Protein rolling stone [Orchesella cincta]|uniref:Protein rolling stone n=1 Tax=Orchesella cincta TaxID=48709 RepID=A0A1D2MVF1_ORCCI|nr:Protein rolling stone [Orchesella cincta]
MTFKRIVSNVKKDFDMNSTSSCVFHHSQWESCREEEHASLPYLLYRVVFMIVFVSSITFSTLCQWNLFPIFLTNWSFMLQTLYAILSCANIIWKKQNYLIHSSCRKFHHIHPEPSAKTFELKAANTWGNVDDNKLNGNGKVGTACINIENNIVLEQNCSTTVLTTDESFLKKSDEDTVAVNGSNNNRSYSSTPTVLEKLIWILMNISHVLPHIVALGYWMFVYKYDPDQPSCERFKSHFIVHGATSIFALIDALIVAVPVRRTHFVFPSCILLLYTSFTWIYEIAGGSYRDGNEYVYAFLNWRYKPGIAAIISCVGVKCQLDVHIDELLYEEEEEYDEEGASTTVKSTSTTGATSRRSTAVPTSIPPVGNLTASNLTNLTAATNGTRANSTFISKPVNGSFFGFEVQSTSLNTGASTERSHYVLNQVGQIWNNVGKLNVTGIIDNALGIRTSNSQFVRPLVSGILNAVFCNPVTFSESNCRKSGRT